MPGPALIKLAVHMYVGQPSCVLFVCIPQTFVVNHFTVHHTPLLFQEFLHTLEPVHVFPLLFVL